MRSTLYALSPVPAFDPGPVSPPRPYVPLPPQRKRVAVAASNAASLLNSCHALILDMVNRGHRVFAFAPELSTNDIRILSHLGAEPRSLAPHGALWGRYESVREFSAILSDARPQILLVESARQGALAVAAGRLARVPKIATVVPSLGADFIEGQGLGAWARRQAMKSLYRALFKRSDAVIFHSAHDRAYAQERRLIEKRKMQLVVGGWGVDLQRHVARPLPPLDQGVLFLMAAPLDRLQGIVEFCEAAKAIHRKTRRARFFLASTPGKAVSPLPTSLLKPYREYVRYVGPVDDPSRLIAKCHVVVAPAYGDGSPRSLFQALALGRPVIATDTRNCRDFVLDGSNGYHVPIRDEAALARAMIQILHRPDLMPRMAETSRKLALRYYDMNTVNALLLEALRL